MTKRQAEKLINDLYMNADELIDKLNERVEKLEEKDTMNDEQELEHEKLSSIIELLQEIKIKIEE